MGLENMGPGVHIDGLDETWPVGTDVKSQGEEH